MDGGRAHQLEGGGFSGHSDGQCRGRATPHDTAQGLDETPEGWLQRTPRHSSPMARAEVDWSQPSEASWGLHRNCSTDNGERTLSRVRVSPCLPGKFLGIRLLNGQVMKIHPVCPLRHTSPNHRCLHTNSNPRASLSLRFSPL